jgi:hypothetical protein
MTLPFPMRYGCAYDPALCRAVRGIFTRSVFTLLRKKGQDCGVLEPKPDASLGWAELASGPSAPTLRHPLASRQGQGLHCRGVPGRAVVRRHPEATF